MLKSIDLKGVISRIKAKYSSDESSFQFFIQNADRLGVLNADSKRKMVDLRGEKTPSTTVTKYLNYCDFGADGIRHDIIFLIQEKYNMSFPEAVKLLAEWEEEPLEPQENDFKAKIIYEEKKEAPPYKEKYLKKMKEQSFEHKEVFKELMKGLCRTCSIEEMRRAVKLFEIGLNSYEEKETGDTIFRLFIPEFNYKKIPYGAFRYNRNLTPKGLLRKNAKRTLFGSHLLAQFNLEKPIVFVEGHSDCVVNNAKGIQSVTSGSSTTKIGEESLRLLQGKTIHFYPDADFAGIKGVCQKIIEIEKFNSTIEEEFEHIKYKIFWWGKNFLPDKIDTTWWKKNFGDTPIPNKIGLKILQKFQIEFFKKEKFHAPEAARFRNWIVFPKEEVKQGYDFIDFHKDYESNSKYHLFKAKYSFI